MEGQLNDPVPAARTGQSKHRVAQARGFFACRARAREAVEEAEGAGTGDLKRRLSADKHQLADMLFDCARLNRRTFISLDSSTTMVRAVCLVDQITFDRIEQHCVSLNV